MQKLNLQGLYGTIQAALVHLKANSWKGQLLLVSAARSLEKW